MTDPKSADVLPFRRVLSETGDSELIVRWFDRAQHADTLSLAGDLIADLAERQDHSMESIVHAAAAAAVAAAVAVLRSPAVAHLGAYESGIAHNLLAWRFIEEFGGFDDGPKRLLQYRKMLYPRFESEFEKTIDEPTMDWLQAQAREALDSGRPLNAAVQFHLELIAGGLPPFHYKVEKTEKKDED